MSNTIWKFPLEVADRQRVEMPAGAQILCVQTQGNTPCLWARVDTESGLEFRRIIIAGTGHTLPDAMYLRYIGTFQLYGGSLIFHVFEDCSDES